MAKSQFRSDKACFTFSGSQWVRGNGGLILGRWILDLDLVCIGGVLDGLGEEEEVFEDEDFVILVFNDEGIKVFNDVEGKVTFSTIAWVVYAVLEDWTGTT